jgi:hypothetical protein
MLVLHMQREHLAMSLLRISPSGRNLGTANLLGTAQHYDYREAV